MKKFLKSLIYQMFPVMLGVYLGFALNNYGENRKLAEQKSVYKQMLVNEITGNLTQVEEALLYHKQLKTDFREILDSENILKSFQSYSLKGLRPGMVNSSAYETGLQTGVIQELDLELIQLINRLYTYQEKYNAINESILDNFIAQSYPETEKEIENILIGLNMSMNDILQFETDLPIFYKKILEML